MKIDSAWYDCMTAGQEIAPTSYAGKYKCPDPVVFCPQVQNWDAPWPTFDTVVPAISKNGGLITIVGAGFNNTNVIVYIGTELGCIQTKSTFTLSETGELTIKCVIGSRPNALIVRGRRVVDVTITDDLGRTATGFKSLTINAGSTIFQSSWYFMAGVLMLLVSSFV